MFYRRKIVFALLEKFEEGLERTRLQKLVFLFSQKQKDPNYEFVPYQFGCYSYSLKADLQAMVKRDWLTSSDNLYISKKTKSYYPELTETDKKLVNETFEQYGKMKTDVITRHTYINFPYFAINSTIASKILPEKYLQKVNEARPSQNRTVLFTIGYEGISLEDYLNKLVKNNVKVLVDVRKNPLSQKYGFSKKLLSGFCKNLNIDYVHIPEVGIDSSKRQELNIQADYDLLFEDYKQTVLKETDKFQDQIFKLLTIHKRIALTCFEGDECQCHRLHLAEKIKSSKNFKFELKHL